MSVATLIRELSKLSGGIPAMVVKNLKNKHLKPGEKLPKDFVSQVNKTKKADAKKKPIKSKVTVKKIPEAPRRTDLGATFRVGGKGGTKSRPKITYGKKAGGPVVKKLIGGIIGSGAKMAAKRAAARVRTEVARKKRIALQKKIADKAKTEAKNIATNKKNRNTRRRGKIAVARQGQERVKSKKGITKPQKGKVLDQTNLIEAGEKAKNPSPILTGRGRTKTTGGKDKVTTTATEEKTRKNIGKTVTDLMTPSSVSTPGSGKALKSATPANEGGVRSSQVAAQTNKKWRGALVKKEKALAKYIEKRDSITDRAKKLQFVNESRTTVTDLKASIADMKKRGGPRVQKMGGGPVIKKKFGSKIASKAIGGPGSMPKKRKSKKMRSGNEYPTGKTKPVVKKMGGGSMNPKKYMNKGGIVRRKKPGKIGSGDQFVRDCYK